MRFREMMISPSRKFLGIFTPRVYLAIASLPLQPTLRPSKFERTIVVTVSLGPQYAFGLANRRDDDVSSDSKTTYGFDEHDLAFRLVHLERKSADLALLVEHWDELPEAIRAGIAAMVRAAKP